ncbi:SDR family oxidoreductase [Oceaniglobus roseus]|uniref:SDR family oxidoreductase n=1 Tax=Oceaniglobus roseus TaxID=1737570 RepID=UPI000C7F624A|nr:SDR family oxidoreductase [Kandeliimicrobium roseum]
MSGPVTAIVLGGSAGVGRAVVSALLDEGHRVGVIARGQARLDEIAAAHGDRVAVASADVADAEALEAAVRGIVGSGDALRVWVNCAMATSFSPFAEVTPEEFDRIVRVTFLGQVNGTRIALKLMERGNIVNVGSGLGYRPVPLQAAYVAAKHAINGFTGALRSELIAEKRPIQLSLVQLPAINTPQFTWAKNRLAHKPQPAPPIFAPELAAKAVVQAAKTGARELLVGKSVLKLVFGDMLLPDYIDRRMSRDGVESQHSDMPEPGGRPDNLFQPVDHPASAAGDFGDRASESGVIVDGDRARKLLLGGAVGAGLVVGFLAGLILD